ncbi:MAG: glycosyltransferase family 39 protein [Pirellulales bacterium]|nr:glycosyltransferase family 39 protein [Pirellulales bacterium]
MSRLVWHHVWIVLAAAAVFFTNLGGAGLFDEDEPKNASCAREMLARGDWVVPRFNEELRTDKPVLLYWLTMPAYACFGVSEFSARLASAVLALGTVLATYHLGRILFRAEVGLWGALALTSALSFDVVARAATPDSTLIFFTTLALWTYAWSVSRRVENVWQRGDELPLDRLADPLTALDVEFAAMRSFAPHAWWGAVLLYAAMGLGVLAKGPVAVVLPTACLGLFLLVVNTPWLTAEGFGIGRREKLRLWILRAVRPLAPRRIGRAAWTLRPVTAVLTVAAVALPWYVLVGLRTDGAWLAGFLGKHNVGRFVTSLENHGGPFFYYLIVLAIGFFPWSIFFSLTGIHVHARLRSRHPWRAGYLLLLCWLGMYLVFFSLARTKLPNYILPAYPALALLTGALIEQWVAEPAALSRRLVRLALGTLGLVGVGLLVGLPIAAYFVLPGEAMIGLVGVIPLVGAIVAYRAVLRNDTARAATVIAMSCTLLACGVFGFAASRVARHQNSPALVALAREQAHGAPQLAAFDCFTPSLVFYAQGRVTPLGMPEDVANFLHSDRRAYLVARVDSLPLLEPVLPAEVRVLARQPRFLRKGELVLLGRAGTSVPALATPSRAVAEELKR